MNTHLLKFLAERSSARQHLVHDDVTIEHLESRLASALSNGDVATAQQVAKQIIEHRKGADARS